jgi:hypothetical protein
VRILDGIFFGTMISGPVALCAFWTVSYGLSALGIPITTFPWKEASMCLIILPNDVVGLLVVKGGQEPLGISMVVAGFIWALLVFGSLEFGRFA